MSVSKRAGLISSSPTLAITAKAKQMKAEGIDVIGFGAGEPDFDTPAHIKDEAKISIDEGFTKYTPASGIVELKEAICLKFKEDNDLDYSSDQIIVSCGAKHCLYNAIQVICDEGDEVILPAPYWVSYPEQIKLAGARPIIIETEEAEDFKITPFQLREAITPKTKLLILNSPCNPTGMVYTEEELQLLSNILVEEEVYCLSDEIYEKIIYDGLKHVSIASLGPGTKRLTVTINGVSKAYAMTGWRIGYSAGPKEIITAMANLQSHSTSNPTSIAQMAAVRALCGPQEQVVEMVKEFKGRRDYMVGRLNRIPGISCLTPQGAFYVFPNISQILGNVFKGQVIKDSISLAEIFLSEAEVAVVPGSAFGADNYIRLSYATSMENITKGLDRIEDLAGKIF